MHKRASDYFETWLKAPALEGKEHTCKITEVEEVQFEGDEAPTLALSFDQFGQKLGLNKTNGRAIIAKLGENVEEWVGKELIIFPDTTLFAGKQVACIRVR